MKRLRRWLLNGAAAASALLCVAACVLWVRSYWRWDMLLHYPQSGEGGWSETYLQALNSNRGIVKLGSRRTNSPLRHEGCWDFWSFPAEPRANVGVGAVRWSAVGCAWRTNTFTANLYGSGPVRWRDDVLRFPHAFVALLLGIPPLLRLAFALRRRPYCGRGVCPACGYDLRAGPEAGGALVDRCPECGAVSDRAG